MWQHEVRGGPNLWQQGIRKGPQLVARKLRSGPRMQTVERSARAADCSLWHKTPLSRWLIGILHCVWHIFISTSSNSAAL